MQFGIHDIIQQGLIANASLFGLSSQVVSTVTRTDQQALTLSAIPDFCFILLKRFAQLLLPWRHAGTELCCPNTADPSPALIQSSLEFRVDSVRLGAGNNLMNGSSHSLCEWRRAAPITSEHVLITSWVNLWRNVSKQNMLLCHPQWFTLYKDQPVHLSQFMCSYHTECTSFIQHLRHCCVIIHCSAVKLFYYYILTVMVKANIL